MQAYTYISLCFCSFFILYFLYIYKFKFPVLKNKYLVLLYMNKYSPSEFIDDEAEVTTEETVTSKCSNTTQKEASIFSIKAYNTKQENIKVSTYSLDEICNKLINKDKGYHLKFTGTEDVILFGDIDHINSNEINLVNNILYELSNFFSIEQSDMALTISEKVDDNELSYHWSFSVYYTSMTKLKEYMEEFINKHQQFKKYVDVSVYKKGWFRLPNQTNKDKKYNHKIINGDMSEFIVNYIPQDAELLPEINIVNPVKPVKPVKEEVDITLNEGKTEEEFIIRLVDILDDDRADDWEKWRNIGFILHNELSDEGFEIFDDFSKRSNKYDKAKVQKFWDSIQDKEDGLTIRSLMKIANKDDKEAYKNICNEFIVNNNKYDNNIEFNFNESITTNSIAEHFKTLHSDKFIYQNNKLYCFNGVYWKAEDKGNLTILNNFISKEYFMYMVNAVRIYEELKLKACIEENDRRKLVETLTKFRSDITLNLLNYDKRAQFIKEILCKLNNDEIKFDENPYLFAFNNKIYNLKEAQFIEPEAKQYISLTTGYNFIEQDETENIKEIETLINSIFPQPELKKLYLTILSTGLDGIPLEKFVIANGGGGNGKGLLNEFIEYMLGNYAYILPNQILLGPLKTGSNPELANMNNKRLVFTKEPDKDLKFNCSTIKEITGGSNINARLNYSNDTKTNLKLTFILECNDKPKLNEVNDALSRRVLDIPFKNKFVDKEEYEETDEEDRMKTVFLKNDIYKSAEFKDKYKQALFLILIEYHKEFLNNNRTLPISDEITKRNRAYLANSDAFYNWFEDNFEKTKNSKDVIKLKVVYNKFKGSEYFSNLNKQAKRDNNYNFFVETMKTNMFLKKYVYEDIHKCGYIKNYIPKPEDNEEDDDEDET